MFHSEKRQIIGKALAGVATVWTLGLGHVSAQSWQPPQYVDSGTSVQVRTTQAIDQSAVDGRVYSAVVDQDVMDSSGHVAIPRGATAELVVRKGPSDELYLDLDSISMSGQRFAVDATRHPVATNGVDVKNSGIGNNTETEKNDAGGALLGTISGAIAGGGKGAAVGAATGAAVGAGVQIYTHGKQINVP